MKELLPFVASARLFSPFGHNVYTAGDVEIKKNLGKFKNYVGTRDEVMEQHTEFAVDIRGNTLRHVEMPPGFGSSFSRLSPMPGIRRSAAITPPRIAPGNCR